MSFLNAVKDEAVVPVNPNPLTSLLKSTFLAACLATDDIVCMCVYVDIAIEDVVVKMVVRICVGWKILIIFFFLSLTSFNVEISDK